jgi:hypothetical protein
MSEGIVLGVADFVYELHRCPNECPESSPLMTKSGHLARDRPHQIHTSIQQCLLKGMV